MRHHTAVFNPFRQMEFEHELVPHPPGMRGIGRAKVIEVDFLANPENRRRMETYRVLWKPTFQELARAGTPMRPAFNPFRQLEDEFAQMKAGEWKGTVYPAGKEPKEREWRWSKF